MSMRFMLKTKTLNIERGIGFQPVDYSDHFTGWKLMPRLETKPRWRLTTDMRDATCSEINKLWKSCNDGRF